MPHKKNPISTENICGLARLYKSYFQTAIDNCLTLLERDISHSSSERIIFKDSAHICCYVLKKLEYILKGINFNVDIAKENLQKFQSKTSSQQSMNELIKKGKTRKESHNIAQEQDN